MENTPLQSEMGEAASLSPARGEILNIDVLFAKTEESSASDIHLVVGKPPIVRIDGVMKPIEAYAPLEREDVQRLVSDVLAMKLSESGEASAQASPQLERFEKEREIDISYEIESGARFRVNCHYEKDNPGLVARLIPSEIPTLEMVHMPEVTNTLINAHQGLVLVTGPTGSGKSTSLAAMIDGINTTRPVHIITLEDPIEFLYTADQAVIRQRQFGTDFLSFSEALKRVLRQDPDVILVGEMRDFETIAAALTLAETGHLVFATLHTNSAAQTVERIIDVFPSHQQEQVRTQLSMTLKAVISQRLVQKKGGGRVALREVLINTPATANIIRDNRIAELANAIQLGTGQGMVTLERDTARLVKDGLLDRETAAQFVADPKSLKRMAPKKKGWFG